MGPGKGPRVCGTPGGGSRFDGNPRTHYPAGPSPPESLETGPRATGTGPIPPPKLRRSCSACSRLVRSASGQQHGNGRVRHLPYPTHAWSACTGQISGIDRPTIAAGAGCGPTTYRCHHCVMDREFARLLIRHRLMERRLPRGHAVELSETVGEGGRCDGCSEAIGPTQTAVWAIVSVNWMSVRLHAECFDLWDTERCSLPHSEPAEAGHPDAARREPARTSAGRSSPVPRMTQACRV